MTDLQLIEALRNQDVNALDLFYRRYRALMYSTAGKMLRDEWELEEVVQDVVWTVWRKAHTFRGESGLSTWVYRITQNAARMLLRKKKRVPVPMEQGDVDMLIEHARQGEVGHLPELIVRGNDVAHHIAEAVAALPQDNRDMFLSIDIYGEDKRVVAAKYGLSISALKARLHRVRKGIRQSAANEVRPAVA